MGLLNFMVDMSQSERLGDHDDEIKELKANVAQLSRWVISLNEQIKELKNERAIERTGDQSKNPNGE